MARKITMFELHFDGVRFGAGPTATETHEEDPTVEAAEDVSGDAQRGYSRARRAFVVGLFVGAALVARQVARRYRGDGEDADIDVEDAEAESTVA